MGFMTQSLETPMGPPKRFSARYTEWRRSHREDAGLNLRCHRADRPQQECPNSPKERRVCLAKKAAPFGNAQGPLRRFVVVCRGPYSDHEPFTRSARQQNTTLGRCPPPGNLPEACCHGDWPWQVFPAVIFYNKRARFRNRILGRLSKGPLPMIFAHHPSRHLEAEHGRWGD